MTFASVLVEFGVLGFEWLGFGVSESRVSGFGIFTSF